MKAVAHARMVIHAILVRTSTCSKEKTICAVIAGLAHCLSMGNVKVWVWLIYSFVFGNRFV